MEYTVIKDLIERKTLKQFKAGDKYPCCDAARAAFLIEHGYIAPIEQPKDADKPEKTDKPQKAPAKRTTKAKKA